MKLVWPGTFVEDGTLVFNISVLRKLLGESPGAPRYIETVPKRGYRFIAGVVEAKEDEPPTSEPTEAQPPLPGRLFRPRTLALLLLALVLVAVTAFFLRGTPELTDKDTIVLGEFTNRTGDPVFDGTLRQGLAIQLEQSPFLSLIPEGRVHQTLHFMNQPPDVVLTPELAREICERTGSAAVLDGSVTGLGSKYVVSLRARNCRSGELIDEQQLQANRKEDVLDVLSQFASKFRSRVGESLASRREHQTPLAEATTPSLEALKAYSADWKLHSARGAIASLPLFKRATEIDPQFAIALSSLGRIYADLDASTPPTSPPNTPPEPGGFAITRVIARSSSSP